jgi:hypothetical protein
MVKDRRWIWISTLTLCIAFVCAVPGAWAQDYKFSLDRNVSRVYVNRDGSADIEYWLTYTCAANAHPIDIIDVGMPNGTYDLSSAEAWFSEGAGGGEEIPLYDIRTSEWLDTGVEVHLESYTLQPGEQGTLHLWINVAQMVYPDSSDEAYASVEFSPTYYDSANLTGTTYLSIELAFPPGVTNEETRYHDREFDQVDVIDDRIVFIYTYPDAKGTDHPLHGISFPASYVDVVNKAPVVIGTGGGGVSSWLNSDALFTTVCVGGVLGIIVIAPVLSIVRSNKRKMKYLPPELSVEGVGIKRGLTAVEAAILLEKPLNKVLTMIMFGLVKKRAIIVTSEDPLRLELADPLPQHEWRKYEEDFLAAIGPKGKLKEGELRTMLIELIKSVNKRMKGFSRKETIAYYASIVDRAWGQVTDESTPEVKSQYFDRNLEWMMMDDAFEERTERTFRTGPVIMPPWWAYYRPWVPMVRSSRTGGGRASTGPSRGSSGGGRQITLPTLPGAAFASTVVTGMERTAGGIVSRLQDFTGGITRRTNPPPVSTSSGSRSSSHRSGGCACACACACAGCACACAGGGR